MKLPPISDPARYAGLYVYDFGSHVSVGYTAAEVRVLRESHEHRDGSAYEIYRVNERGGFELRGATDERLATSEAVCFLRHDGAAARRDFESIRAAADANPLPIRAELLLGRFYSFTPSNVTALVYSAGTSATASGWLSRHGPALGDDVRGGVDTCRTLLASDGVRIASCELPTGIDLRDRPVEEVLRTVNEPIQR
jgi:hypothetical protein